MLDIREEIKNRNLGIHYIELEDQEKLKKQLEQIKEEGLFEKYQMTYSTRKDNDYIILAFFKRINFVKA